MIIGLPRWDNPDAYYSQENNAIEEVLREAGNLAGLGWLETCGPTAAVTILDCLGAHVKTLSPGGWSPQPEDVLTLYLQDPRNAKVLQSIRADIDPGKMPGNRVPQYYKVAIPAVFGIPATFAWGLTPGSIINALEAKRGVMACMKKPGHYVAIVAYDLKTNEAIYHDPWKGNKWPARYANKPGSCRRVTTAEIEQNFQQYRVEIG